LIKCGPLNIIAGADADPTGCIKNYINDKLSIFLKAGDLAAKELIRLEKKRKELQKAVESLEKKMSMKDYENKVPEKVRKENTAKMEALTSELAENLKSEEELKKI